MAEDFAKKIIPCKAFEAVNSILRILVGKTDNNDCNEKCYAENLPLSEELFNGTSGLYIDDCT